MNAYYGRSKYCYDSKFDDQDFKTAAQAREYDRKRAAAVVAALDGDDVATALATGSPLLAEMLRFLAGEIDDAAIEAGPCPADKPETA